MTLYCCIPDIVWTRDADQTLLVSPGQGQGWALRGVEATVWDLLTLHYPFERIVGFLAELLQLSGEEATRQLLAVVQGWEQAGIMHARQEDRCGQSSDQRRL